MAEFKLNFDTDSDAFCDGNGPSEVARILRLLALKIQYGQEEGVIYDLNGNRIGSWTLDLPAKEDAP